MSVFPTKAKPAEIQSLLDVMASLRGPGGCPWDQKQTFESLLPYLQEESAEYIDAVREGDLSGMKEELGDVLLQVAFHAQLAEEAEHFSFQDVVQTLVDKLVFRHPHVFGNVEGVDSAEDVESVWAKQKALEKSSISISQTLQSPVHGVPKSMHPLERCFEMSRKASKVGFDWEHPAQIVDKVREELAELEQGLEAEDDANIQEELGDLLFAVTNLCRKLGVRPDAALAASNRKFEKRLEYVAKRLEADGLTFAKEHRNSMEAHWNEARALRVEHQNEQV